MPTIYIVCGIILIVCAVVKIIFSIVMRGYWKEQADSSKFLEILLIISFLLMGISNIARGIDMNKSTEPIVVMEVVNDSSTGY